MLKGVVLTLRHSSKTLIADDRVHSLHLHWPQCDFEGRRLDSSCDEAPQHISHGHSKRDPVPITRFNSLQRLRVQQLYHTLIEEDPLDRFGCSNSDLALAEFLVGAAVVWGGGHVVHLGVNPVHDGRQVALPVKVTAEASDVHENCGSELVQDEGEREASLNRQPQVLQPRQPVRKWLVYIDGVLKLYLYLRTT